MGNCESKKNICFIGNFNVEYLQHKFADYFLEFTFIEKSNNVSSLVSEYDFIFISDNELNNLIYFYDSQKPVEIKIEKGNVDECVNGLILMLSPTVISLDMYDVTLALGFGNKASYEWYKGTEAHRYCRRAQVFYN